MLDVKKSDKMIYRLTLYMDPVILSQLRKKKLYCVSATITEKDVICKLKTPDLLKMIYLLSFDGENFETVMSSKCDHEFTFGLVNYRGSPLTTGSEFNSDCFLKTEVYNFETSRWNDAPDYPYSS